MAELRAMYLALGIILSDNPADQIEGMIWAVLFIGIGFAVYFLPSIVAWNKGDRWSVVAINFFLGWTLIGWVIALAWGLKQDKSQIIVQTPAPINALPVLCPGCRKYSQGGSNFCSQCGMKWALR